MVIFVPAISVFNSTSAKVICLNIPSPAPILDTVLSEPAGPVAPVSPFSPCSFTIEKEDSGP